MKKIFVLLPLVLMLSACGEESKIKEVIRNNLKDPGSAQFKDAVVSADAKRACLVWNSKNSMGGYGDWHTAELEKKGTEWTVKEMDGSDFNCSENGFAAIDAEEKAKSEAYENAIAMLQKARKISKPAAVELAKGAGECFMWVLSYQSSSGSLADRKVRQLPTKDASMDLEEDVRAKKEKLEKGDCSGDPF